MKKPELLLPAASLDKMRTAYAYGADAVYAGQPRYSLRVRNNEFMMEQLAQGIAEAHAMGKQFYVASNLMPHNAKVKTYMADMEPVIAMQPDALIMADPGLIAMVREKWPEQVIHLSVQANTVNYAAVKFWKSVGVSRVILSRELSLDESLVAREKIATNLQRILNTFAVEWGLTVSKVEIRLIDPPDDIKKAMHKQKTAEQERRSMKLLATGEFEAAQQQKLAIIQRAEGEREAVIQVAQGKAEAIRLVNEAAEKYFVGNAQALKQLEMVETALRDNTKVVITEHGISPTLLLGSLPISPPGEKKNGRDVKILG
jgi:hypothetical protein